jgi:CDP-diglyceride synthetase
MLSGSPKDTALGSIIGIVLISVLAGMSFIVGVQKWASGDPIYILNLLLLPLLGFAIVLVSRRILKVIA